VLFLSTRERLRPPAGLPHLDKAAHFAEYALLGALVHRALRRSGVGRAGSWILTGLVVGGLGAGDEWLQGRVRGRESSALDWLADFAGGWIGAGLDEWRRARAAARAPRRAEEEAGGAVIGDTEG
jgi:VanZ family protein